MDWTQIKIFKGIDLNDSFILHWVHEGDQLTFDLEASIWPESEHYAKPVDGEHTCYRKSALKFTSVKSVDGLIPIEMTPSTTDPDGTTDYGNIDTLSRTNSGFNLSGDFGSVNIIGGHLSFEVYT